MEPHTHTAVACSGACLPPPLRQPAFAARPSQTHRARTHTHTHTPTHRLYGRVLNLDRVGMSFSDGGAFYSKAARGFDAPQRRFGGKGRGSGGSSFFLSVQDPLDAHNDTARGSWNMKAVRLVRCCVVVCVACCARPAAHRRLAQHVGLHNPHTRTHCGTHTHSHARTRLPPAPVAHGPPRVARTRCSTTPTSC
jgi:hypothetical protein